MDQTTQTIYIVIILFCLVMSGYFSATETAFSTLNRTRVQAMADKGNKRAKNVLKLEENFDGLLTTILIGNNLVNILMASLATLLFIGWVGEGTGPTLSTIVTTIVVLIFGEITPKSIAKERPEKFAFFSYPLIKALTILFIPFVFLFSLWKKLINKMLKPEDEESMADEEIVTIVKEAVKDGEYDEDESQLIRNTVQFNDLSVGDILTPRIDVTAIPEDMSIEEISKTYIETGYSRIPVYKEELDDIIGILYYKDFYAKKEENNNKEFDIHPLLKPVISLKQQELINDVLKEFQTKQVHFGVIYDEFGSMCGIVTLEDILEEIVGEIWDEHDQVEEEIEEVEDKVYRVSGKASIVKLLNMLEIDEEVDSLTVNGWVMDNCPDFPTTDTKFSWKGLDVTVEKMDGKRIDTVKIIDNRKDEDEDEETSLKDLFHKNKDDEDEKDDKED